MSTVTATPKKKKVREFPKSKIKPGAEASPITGEFPALPMPPHQPDLPALADPVVEEIRGVVDHYRTVKADAKRITDKQKMLVDDATQKVIDVLRKHNRSSLVIDGILAQVLVEIKVKVKGARAKKRKPKKTASKSQGKKKSSKSEGSAK